MTIVYLSFCPNIETIIYFIYQKLNKNFCHTGMLCQPDFTRIRTYFTSLLIRTELIVQKCMITIKKIKHNPQPQCRWGEGKKSTKMYTCGRTKLATS